MYRWIFDNLKSLDLQTQLLEACGWDEDEVEMYVTMVGDGLNHATGTDIIVQVKQILIDAPADVTDIIVKIVEREAIDAFHEMMNPDLLN